MSMTPHPHRPNTAPLRSWQQQEWDHWMNLPQKHLLLIALPNLLLLCIDPLLPFVAYLLQRWAGSWTWRDRWASIWVWAKQGAWWIAFLATITLLETMHVGFVPQFIAAAQSFWQAHLPGDLSLSPFDGQDLLARSLLLLPLAPALALLDEWLDPRTPVTLHRILTPADRKKPASPAPAETTQETNTNPVAAPDTLPASPTPRTKTTRTKRRRPPAGQQMTIDSMLATDTPSTKNLEKTVTPEPAAEVEKDKPPKDINWDDVLE